MAQRDIQVDAPGAVDLFTIGVRAVIRKASRTKEDHADILVFGLERIAMICLL